MTAKSNKTKTTPFINKDSQVKLYNNLKLRFSWLFHLRNTIGEDYPIYKIDENSFPVLKLDTVNSLVDFVALLFFFVDCIERSVIIEKVFTGELMWVVIDQDKYIEICQEYGIPVEAFKVS